VRLATIGLNPSNIEFLDGDSSAFFSEGERRLATLESLGAHSTDDLDQRQVKQVVEDCARYFESDRNPYNTWFKPLDAIIQRAFGDEWSYYNKTVCHLDLVQWATDPKWNDLSKPQKDILIEDGRDHLYEQLKTEKIEMVLVNGAGVWDELVRLESFNVVGESETGFFSVNHTKYKRVRGERLGVNFFGWTCNIQSQPGANEKQLSIDLSEWLHKVAAPHLSHQ
jgi:hypothetical protein